MVEDKPDGFLFVVPSLEHKVHSEIVLYETRDEIIELLRSRGEGECVSEHFLRVDNKLSEYFGLLCAYKEVYGSYGSSVTFK